MLVVYNRVGKCHTFWRLVIPPGDATNSSHSEHPTYILALELYKETDGTSAEVLRLILIWFEPGFGT